jgi:hypothetical protein
MARRRESTVELPSLLPKQQFAFETLANEILLGGATRGGKTFANKLMLIRLCSAVSNLQCDIFRLHLDDVYNSYMEGEDSFNVLLAPWIRDKLVTITKQEIYFTWTNSRITLEHLGSDSAKSKGQGTPKQIRIFDEATQLLETRFRFLRGWVTITEAHKKIAAEELKQVFPNMTLEERLSYFPRIIYSTNPVGVSAGYFRRGFVKAARKYEIFQAPPEDGGFKRVYIPFLVTDNPHEDPEAVKRRISGLGDAALTDALLNENWDAPVGDFIREYDENKHKVNDFEPPEHWVKFRAFDWGGDDPFCVLWACISDGNEFRDNEGNTRWYPRNSIIVYREWYGCQENDQARGINMPNSDIAKGIVARTPERTSNITLTDSLPFQRRGGLLMATEFANEGVPLTHANTDRVIGWKKVRDLLIGKDNIPYLYIAESCRYLREYLPALQRHATKVDDAVDSGEATHACDTLRYLCATQAISLPKAPEKVPDRLPPSPRLSISPAHILKQRQTKHGTRRTR